MSSRRTLPFSRTVTLGCCLLMITAGLAFGLAGTAGASLYKMVLCGSGTAAGAASFGPISESNSQDFVFESSCQTAGSFPAGNEGYFRIAETRSAGQMSDGSFGRVVWKAPPSIAIFAAGGFARQPNDLDDGVQATFWAERSDGSTISILQQSDDEINGGCNGVCWRTALDWQSHLWPYAGFNNMRSFAFELKCERAGGCQRSRMNIFDANSFVFVLDDATPPNVEFSGEEGIVSGQWVRGVQTATWNASDSGSGLRMERLRIDGVEQFRLDYGPECEVGYDISNGEFARSFKPCEPERPVARSAELDTTDLPDGTHSLQVCAQDYSQYVGMNGTGGETCERRFIRTDNTPPAAPIGLEISGENDRYLSHFDAKWSLDPDTHSPLSKMHYDIVNKAGEVVVPQKTISHATPTELRGIEAPPQEGEYRLRVWLEDAVGNLSPRATVPLPHDSKAPAAPQALSVTPSGTPRAADGFDIRWRNAADEGAPIAAAHYEILSPSGATVVPTVTVTGDNPQAIPNLRTPRDGGSFSLRLWLSDAAGNVGAAVVAPLTYTCPRSDGPAGGWVTAAVGSKGETRGVIPQGSGSALSGTVRGSTGPVAGSPVCVFSKVVTASSREFVGTAVASGSGEFYFPIPAGPSRELAAVYRADHRQSEARVLLETQVIPTLKVKKRSGRRVILVGSIPGPNNGNVPGVLEMKRKAGWRPIGRFRTNGGGLFTAGYRMTRTPTRSNHGIGSHDGHLRARVRAPSGYPYLSGSSRKLTVRFR